MNDSSKIQHCGGTEPMKITREEILEGIGDDSRRQGINFKFYQDGIINKKIMIGFLKMEVKKPSSNTEGETNKMDILEKSFNKNYPNGVVLPYKHFDPKIEQEFVKAFLKEHPDWQEASIAYGVAVEITCKVSRTYLDMILTNFFHEHMEFFRGMGKVILYER